VGEAWLLRETAAQIGLPAPERVLTDIVDLSADASVSVLDRGCVQPGQFAPGRLSAVCGQAAVEYIRTATRLCLDGIAHAMTTAPVNKEAVTLASVPFTGHTEYIAQMCGVESPRMLLVNDRMRVVHVTTHCSLREACSVDAASVLRTVELGHQAMQRLGFAAPRIAVCGLNPHAGEHGLFGSEDAQNIAPAVQRAREQGILCDGPLAADTLFYRAAQGEFDLVVALYHDQGHIPMKLLDFANTVNVTLGLPIIRTSVDHGTAFDLVGQNRADPRSMMAALRLAAQMALGAKR
jgi:4-hydroxythreonine-4-phosphate dehydrogenase